MIETYYEDSMWQLREIGFTTVQQLSHKKNGSHASATIYRTYTKRKGHSGFKVALGNSVSHGLSWAVL